MIYESTERNFKHACLGLAVCLLQAVIKSVCLWMAATLSSAECSFSSLKRLKTYLRNSMGLERLSNLALLHIERENVNKVSKEEMDNTIKTFGQRSGRNKYFLSD